MYNEVIQPYIKTYLDELGKSQMAEIIEYSLKDGKCLRGFIVVRGWHVPVHRGICAYMQQHA